MKIALSARIQKLLWIVGIAIHNPIRNECTPDFNCCNDIGRKAMIKLKQTKN